MYSFLFGRKICVNRYDHRPSRMRTLAAILDDFVLDILDTLERRIE